MIHLQQPVDGWLEAVAKLPSTSVNKAVISVQWLSEMKAANPGALTLHRHWNDPFQNVSPSDTEAIREQRAREWFEQFVDGTFLNGSTAGIPHWKATDLVSWWNEYYAQSQTAAEKELWWRQERAAAKVWWHEYRNGPNKAKLGHIRLAICAAPVGNDIPVQSAETAAMYDCVLDYHAYDHWINGQRDPGSWQFHCGRWASMDAVFRAAGFSCLWLFGEAGPYSSAVDGWKSAGCCGNDPVRYVEAVRWFIQQCRGTVAYQQGRVLGFNLFTTGGGSQWKQFETGQPVLNLLADMYRAEWKPGSPPPPPPPPADPCQPRQKYGRVYVVLPQNATKQQFAAVAEKYHGDRRTIGFSYDDAGHGPGLTSKTAILLGIPAGQQQVFKDWYALHYPGTAVQFEVLPTAPF